MQPLLEPFRDMATMIGDIRRRSVWLGHWGAALNIPLMVGGAGYITRPAGIAIFVSNLVAVMIAGRIHKRQPFSRLTSICHVAWIPAIVLGLIAIASPEAPLPFVAWLAFSLMMMAISLVLDVRNLYVYFCTEDPGELVG